MDVDPEGPAGDLPRARPIDAYGSLRVATVWDTDGHRDIRNNGTRLGVRGQKEFIGSLTAFARLEAGVNMVANDRAIITSGDPGTPIGQGSQAVSSRLGLVGLETPIGNFSWGKQWSPYYDVAEFTDQFVIFSGFANGAFGAGTDGGISGTGRAERAVQYRGAQGCLQWGPAGAKPLIVVQRQKLCGCVGRLRGRGCRGSVSALAPPTTRCATAWPCRPPTKRSSETKRRCLP